MRQGLRYHSGTAGGGDPVGVVRGLAGALAVGTMGASASESFPAGVFIGCFGSKPCTESLTIKEGRRTIGYRGSETIAADNGGIVHVQLIALARRASPMAG